MSELTRPADPAPTTTRSQSKRRGLGHLPSARRSLITSSPRRATQGKSPRSTKEPMSAGDRMPSSDSMRASWVPAFTNTAVPASIPTWLTQAKVKARMGVSAIARLTTKKGKIGTRRRVKR